MYGTVVLHEEHDAMVKSENCHHFYFLVSHFVLFTDYSYILFVDDILSVLCYHRQPLRVSLCQCTIRVLYGLRIERVISIVLLTLLYFIVSSSGLDLVVIHAGDHRVWHL